MALEIAGVIRWGCGDVLWGEGEEELLQTADLHVRIAHRDLVGTLSPLELARRAGRDQRSPESGKRRSEERHVIENPPRRGHSARTL